MRHQLAAFIVSILAIVFYSSSVFAQPRQQPGPPKVSETDPLRGMVWNEALDAGTNIRYWSTMAERAAAAEAKTRNWAIATGLFCFAFPFIARQYVTGTAAKWCAGSAELIGVIAFGFSMISMLDRAATYNDLTAIHNRWATLKPQFDELFDVSHTLTHDQLQLRYDALMKAKLGIVPIEPAPTDEDLMHQSWRAEMHARNMDDWVAQMDAKKKAHNN